MLLLRPQITCKMKKLLLFALVCGAASVSAQPVVNNFYPTAPGSWSTTMIECDTTGITQGVGGANQNWNFTVTYVDTAMEFTTNYVDAATTPYADLFPAANLASATDSVAAYTYYLSTPTQYSYLGYAALIDTAIFSIVFTDPQDMTFPITFGSSQTDTYGYADTSDFSGVMFIQGSNGVSTWTYDGYGTLTVNGESFNNVVRLYSTDIDTSSTITIIPDFDTTVSMTSYASQSYIWLDPANGEFLFSVQYTQMTDENGVVTSDKAVFTAETDPATSVASTKSVGISLYPSVTDRGSLVTLNSNETASVSVFDAVGKTVYTNVLPASQNSFYLNTTAFAAGLYLVKVQTESGATATKKLIVK